MKVIYDYRQTGRTTKLIKMSAEKYEYILVPNRQRAMVIAKMAQDMGLDIPFPITVSEYFSGKLKGSFISRILIDDADIILQEIFNCVAIDCITVEKTEENK